MQMTLVTFMKLLQRLMTSSLSIWYKIAILLAICFSCTKEVDVYDISPNSIVIVPDIQIYTNTGCSPELNSIVNFINTNKQDISVCLQTGDLTNNNAPSQWDNAFNYYINKLDPDILHFECLGNHDYGREGLADQRVSNIPWNISNNSFISFGDYHENYVNFFRVNGCEYGVIVLEFAVRESTLKWAENILKQYPTTHFLLLTHAFLNEGGNMYGDEIVGSDYDNPIAYALNEGNVSCSKQVFDSLCGQYSNIKYIICGHSLPQKGYIIKTHMNLQGDPVGVILVNFQHFTNGGNGNIAVLNLAERKVDIISTQTIESIESLNF